MGYDNLKEEPNGKIPGAEFPTREPETTISCRLPNPLSRGVHGSRSAEAISLFLDSVDGSLKVYMSYVPGVLAPL